LENFFFVLAVFSVSETVYGDVNGSTANARLCAILHVKRVHSS